MSRTKRATLLKEQQTPTRDTMWLSPALSSAYHLERGKAASAEDSGHYSTREITARLDAVLRNRAAVDRRFASPAPTGRYNYRMG